MLVNMQAAGRYKSDNVPSEGRGWAKNLACGFAQAECQKANAD